MEERAPLLAGGDSAASSPDAALSSVLQPWKAPRNSLRSRLTFTLAVIWLAIAGFGPPWALFSVFEKVGLYYLENTVPFVEDKAYYYLAFSVALAIALGRTAIILQITFARERLAALPDHHRDKKLRPLSAYWWCNPFGLAFSGIFVFGDGVGRVWAQVSMWDALGGLYFASPNGLFPLPWYFATSLAIALTSGVFRVSWWIWYWGTFSRINGPAPLAATKPDHPLAGAGGHTDPEEPLALRRPVRTPSAADLLALDDSEDGAGDGRQPARAYNNTAAGSLQASGSSDLSLSSDRGGESPSRPTPGPETGATHLAREDGIQSTTASASKAAPHADHERSALQRAIAAVRRTARSIYPSVVAVVPMPIHRGVQYLFRYMDGFGRTWAMFAVFNQFALASQWPSGEAFFSKEAYVWSSISVAFLGGCYVVFKGTYRRFKVFLH